MEYCNCVGPALRQASEAEGADGGLYCGEVA